MRRSRCRSSMACNKGYAWSVEYTDDPHPRNTYWEMFGMPMFDLKDAAGVLLELQHCRKTFPDHYIRLMAFDSTRGVESIVMSFIVNRPKSEPGFGLMRQEAHGRTMRYTVHRHAADRGERTRHPRRSAPGLLTWPHGMYSIPGGSAPSAQAASDAELLRGALAGPYGQRSARAIAKSARSSRSSNATSLDLRRSSPASATSRRCWSSTSFA